MRHIVSIAGMFLALAALAEAKPASLARTLPSNVKKISLLPTRAPKRAVHKQKPKKISPPSKAAPLKPRWNAPLAEDILDPSTSRYSTRTVFFWHSPSRLPSSYRCDEEMSATKKQEAEEQALAKCAANGSENCTLREVKIVKNGPLGCQDIPGDNCQRSHHYAGCVAVAVVLGEKI